MSQASGAGQVPEGNFDISVLISSKASNARVATRSCADTSKAVTSESGIPYTTSVNVNDIRAADDSSSRKALVRGRKRRVHSHFGMPARIRRTTGENLGVKMDVSRVPPGTPGS